jgi:hypothetical protein
MGAPDPVQLLTALTTEHFTLQGARSQTMSETSARASIYMFSVSSVLVALGFVSQVGDGVGAVFDVFALTVLPVIYFLGCVTYLRLVECGAEDLPYGMRSTASVGTTRSWRTIVPTCSSSQRMTTPPGSF